MKPGDVVLTPVPQADGATKNRPALVLREMPAYRDLLVCGISTQLHQEVKGFDEVILRSDSDFATSSLKSDSIIRLGFRRSYQEEILSAQSVRSLPNATAGYSRH
jgi:mRNA interferase MazF